MGTTHNQIFSHKNVMRNLRRLAFIGVMTPALVACSKSGGGDSAISSQSAGSGVQSKFNVNIHKVSDVVCDPLTGGGGSPAPQDGVRATLYPKGALDPVYHDVTSMVTKLTASTQQLFFTDMNVPTRYFTEGFSTQSSAVVKDDLGSKLIENFGLKFETNLTLGENDSEGDYELAILSDDGAMVNTVIGGQSVQLINNDGDHPTQMGCAKQLVHLTREIGLPLEVTYYQGPRYHIANVLMWRKSSTVAKDPQCGKQGNNYFFDPDNGSKQLQPYKDLLARGWTPVGASNFKVPAVDDYNPCTVGTSPKISGFIVLGSAATSADVQWTTDILSTSQVMVMNVSTGVTVTTDADNLMRTSHSVHITGLSPASLYTVQAVSVSDDLGKSISSPITLTTKSQ